MSISCITRQPTIYSWITLWNPGSCVYVRVLIRDTINGKAKQSKTKEERNFSRNFSNYKVEIE